jgi:uncharacterized protein (TIRG00374 family)
VRAVLGLVVTAAFLLLVSQRVPADALGRLASAQWLYTVPALLCLAAAYLLRILRWRHMLESSMADIPYTDAASPYLISIAANNVLPFRAGDILRMFAFRHHRGGDAGAVGGTLVVERILDLLVLLVILTTVLFFMPSREMAILSSLAFWSGVLAVAGLMCLFSIPLIRRIVLSVFAGPLQRDPPGLLGTLAAFGLSVMDSILALGTSRRLAVLAGLSILAWICEGGVFLFVAQAVGIEGGWRVAYLTLAVATLSTLIPSSPGYVGTFHFFAMQAAIFLGNLEAEAALFAIATHLMLWLPTTLAGALAFAWRSLRGTPSAANTDILQ